MNLYEYSHLNGCCYSQFFGCCILLLKCCDNNIVRIHECCLIIPRLRNSNKNSTRLICA